MATDEIDEKEGQEGSEGKESKDQGNSKKGGKYLRNKEMTAKEFAGIIGVNERTKFWVKKKFKSTEKKKANEWCDLFISEGAISERPAILDQKV